MHQLQQQNPTERQKMKSQHTDPSTQSFSMDNNGKADLDINKTIYDKNPTDKNYQVRQQQQQFGFQNSNQLQQSLDFEKKSNPEILQAKQTSSSRMLEELPEKKSQRQIIIELFETLDQIGVKDQRVKKLKEALLLDKQEQQLTCCCRENEKIYLCKRKICRYHQSCLSRMINSTDNVQPQCSCKKNIPFSYYKDIGTVETIFRMENILDSQMKILLAQISLKNIQLYRCPSPFCTFIWFFNHHQNQTKQISSINSNNQVHQVNQFNQVTLVNNSYCQECETLVVPEPVQPVQQALHPKQGQQGYQAQQVQLGFQVQQNYQVQQAYEDKKIQRIDTIGSKQYNISQ